MHTFGFNFLSLVFHLCQLPASAISHYHFDKKWWHSISIDDVLHRQHLAPISTDVTGNNFIIQTNIYPIDDIFTLYHILLHIRNNHNQCELFHKYISKLHVYNCTHWYQAILSSFSSSVDLCFRIEFGPFWQFQPVSVLSIQFPLSYSAFPDVYFVRTFAINSASWNKQSCCSNSGFLVMAKVNLVCLYRGVVLTDQQTNWACWFERFRPLQSGSWGISLNIKHSRLREFTCFYNGCFLVEFGRENKNHFACPNIEIPIRLKPSTAVTQLWFPVSWLA